MTVKEALAHAARLLAEAELERMNLPLMERLESLADRWIEAARVAADAQSTGSL